MNRNSYYEQAEVSLDSVLLEEVVIFHGREKLA